MRRRFQPPRPDLTEIPRSSSVWRDIVAADLELIWSVQDTVRGWPIWIQHNLSRVVSHHPLRDVSIITWFVFLLGCRRFGFHFFWACCINLAGAAFLRLLLSAPRPFMYDQRLRPLTDRYETSHGLPSLETHMATVVAGWWAESGGAGDGVGATGDNGVRPLVRLLAVGYIAFVGFTRVYACSRFVHQVVLSFVTGAVGLAWGWRLSNHLEGLGLMLRHHVRGAVVVAIIALGMLAYQVENNESQLMGVKKKEYLRVLSDIVKESQQSQSATVGGTEDDEDEGGEWVIRDGAPWDGRMDASVRRPRLDERRDSFHFLQRAVERRASIYPRTNSGNSAPSATAWGIARERTSVGSEFEGRERRGDTRSSRLREGGRIFAAAEEAWGASLG